MYFKINHQNWFQNRGVFSTYYMSSWKRSFEQITSVVFAGSRKEVISEKCNKMKISKDILFQSSKKFCDTTTLHGFKYIYDKNLSIFERLFFGISIAAVCVVSTNFIFNVYQKWNKNPVIVGIDPVLTFINKVPFPAITICNMNQVLKSKAESFTGSKDSAEYAMLLSLCNMDVTPDMISNRTTGTNWETYGSFLSESAQPCSAMLLKCTFGGIVNNCSEIFLPVLTDEGLCCVFNTVSTEYMFTRSALSRINNSIPNTYVPIDWNIESGYPSKLPQHYYPRVASGPGESLGFTVILNAEVHDYFCSSTNTAGFKILLHNPTETPLVKEMGLTLQAGYETKFRIMPDKSDANEDIRSIKPEYRQCVFNNENPLLYYRTYSRRNCEMECEAQLYLEKCNCIKYYMPRIYSNSSVCGIKDIPCIQNISRSSIAFKSKELSCNDICMPSCFDLTFLPVSFSAPIVTKDFKTRENFIENYTEDYAESNIAIVNFYYKENSFRSSVKSQYIGITEFLSNTGGLMGLFIGFSFISLVEIFYYAVIQPFSSIKKNQKGGKKAPTNKKKIRVLYSSRYHRALNSRSYLGGVTGYRVNRCPCRI